MVQIVFLLLLKKVNNGNSGWYYGRPKIKDSIAPNLSHVLWNPLLFTINFFELLLLLLFELLFYQKKSF